MMYAIGQLTGGIAHDFNNLLGSIIGNVESPVDTAHDREQATLAREILNSALSGADLTRRLLAFARRQSLQSQRLQRCSARPFNRANKLNNAELSRRALGTC